jgi:hypothetical protein
MPRIFVAPADTAPDKACLERSIINPVDRQAIIKTFSDATYPELIDIERRGRGFYAWGFPSEAEYVEKWFQMGIGDFVLMTFDGAYRYYGKVLGRYDNRRAANAIWGEPSDGETARELLFFLSEPIALTLPTNELQDYFPQPKERFSQIPAEVMDRIEGDFGSVERFFRHRLLNMNAGGPVLDMSGIIKLSEREQAKLYAFDPKSTKDGRERIVETITKRRGQPQMRLSLLAAYDHTCAVTGCNALDALEAAYIIPYRGKYTHHSSNGLLLRADIHTLFDLGKIAVDTRSMTLVVSDELHNTTYRILADRPLKYPQEDSQRPSTEALDLHRRLVGL